MRSQFLPLYALILILAFLLNYLSGCDTNPYKQGKRLYEQNCQNCHQEDGKAVATLIPPLAGSEYIGKTEDVVCIIRYGLTGEIIVNGVKYNHEMPANDILSSIQIANIINYISNSWGNEGPYVSFKKVEEILSECEGKTED